MKPSRSTHVNIARTVTVTEGQTPASCPPGTGFCVLGLNNPGTGTFGFLTLVSPCAKVIPGLTKPSCLGISSGGGCCGLDQLCCRGGFCCEAGFSCGESESIPACCSGSACFTVSTATSTSARATAPGIIGPTTLELPFNQSSTIKTRATESESPSSGAVTWESSSSSRLSGETIAGVAVGVCTACALVIALLVSLCLQRRRRIRAQSSEATVSQSPFRPRFVPVGGRHELQPEDRILAELEVGPCGGKMYEADGRMVEELDGVEMPLELVAPDS
ncbi:hypothetical protein B0T24DRAFT_200449 [Lasiosphaeria ovina]|uniref:Uncharacterized protein n=1 Tax=Lasiosphaeria ovina TaxID=92902 RepID=A0AAE0TV26_9PEZI|nr:hypothetical protein B0T24DRAFT_200449 [Lasiosphaeria ovina]